MAQDGDAVAPDAKHLGPLQVQVAVQGPDDHITGSKENANGPERRVIWEVRSKSMLKDGTDGD
jgi:hypothetical protein